MIPRLVLAAVAGLLTAQATSEVSPPRFAVAGVYIGESPGDAVGALKSEKYRITKVSRSDSFAQRLSDAKNAELRHPIDKNRRTDVGSVFAEEADQRVRVNFDDDEKSVRVVSSVYYQASSVAHPFSRALRTLMERYGRPQAGDGTGYVWCTVDPPDICLAGGVRGDRIKLGHDHRGFDPDAELTTIQLEPGTNLLNSWRAGFRAALARLLRSRDAF